MPRVFSLRRDGRSTVQLYAALGLAPPVTMPVITPAYLARTWQRHAPALAAEAVALWERTRCRVVTLDQAAREDFLVASASRLVPLDLHA
jgi:hypothetical protein